MPEVSTLRLYLLRAMYLLVAVGLGVTISPMIVAPPDTTADAKTVIPAVLGALAVLSSLGFATHFRCFRYSCLSCFGRSSGSSHSHSARGVYTGLDEYASETLFACLMSVVLVPIVIPWGYVIKHYVRAAGDPWRKPNPPRLPESTTTGGGVWYSGKK